MNNKNTQQILIGAAVVCREYRKKKQFLLVKVREGDVWEVPKVTVRKGESSVRAVIRMIGEQGGITARVLEEVGRTTGSVVVNGKAIPQRTYYYLMLQRAVGGETIGFHDFKWIEHQKVAKTLDLKKEKDIFKGVKDTLKEWDKNKRQKMVEEEEAALLQQEAEAKLAS